MNTLRSFRLTRPLGCALAFLTTVSLLVPLPAAAQFVTVGNPGNGNDPGTSSLYGGVSYTYAISTYEVTLNQYTTFLNAVAATDTFALYNTSMASNANIAGISRANGSGSYVYSVIGDGARPVAYVSFYDAMRYANWLGTGSTETGPIPCWAGRRRRAMGRR